MISRWTSTKCTLVTWMMSRLYWFLCISAHFQVKKTLYEYVSIFNVFSDSGRKPIMLVPFLGHIISGTLMILICIFPAWDARLIFSGKKIKTRSKKWLYFFRYIWLGESYILFGGYSLLNIAMYGYIGREALKWIFQTQNLNYFSPKKKTT